MKLLPDGRIQCRVRITGTFRGTPFSGEDSPESTGGQFIWPEDEEGNIDPSTWWWSDGNMACDCNRSEYLPAELVAQLAKRQPDGKGDEDGVRCGHEIRIDEIVPLELGPNGETLPTLYLNESP